VHTDCIKSSRCCACAMNTRLQRMALFLLLIYTATFCQITTTGAFNIRGSSWSQSRRAYTFANGKDSGKDVTIQGTLQPRDCNVLLRQLQQEHQVLCVLLSSCHYTVISDKRVQQLCLMALARACVWVSTVYVRSTGTCVHRRAHTLHMLHGLLFLVSNITTYVALLSMFCYNYIQTD
jgi:hypothetical protein